MTIEPEVRQSTTAVENLSSMKAARASDLQASAVRGSIWTMAHVAVSVPIAFAANAVVARALGVEDYGRLAILTLALGIAVAVSNAGVSDGTIQWGAAAHARGDRAEVESLLRRSLGFHALVQLPVLLIFIAVVARNQSWLVITALVLSVAFPALLGSSSLMLTIENRTAVSAQLAIVTNLITQISVAATAVTSHAPPAVWAARNAVSAILIPVNFMVLDAGCCREP